MEELRLIFDPLPGDALSNLVADKVMTANIAKTGVSEWHPVGYFLRNDRGEFLGGLSGQIWGGWLHVKFLWVAEPLRGQGHGNRLMDAAEAFAVERGAFAATLESHSFGARDFYLKRGYVVFGQLDNYPPGHTKVFLRKQIGPTIISPHS